MTAAAVMAVLFVVAAVAALSGKELTTVAKVAKPDVTGVTDSSITLRWREVRGADSYRVYFAEASGNTTQRITASHCEAVLGGLSQASVYKIYVTACKTHFGKTVESKSYTPVTAVTLPSQQNVVAAASADVGQLTVEWEENRAADGYRIEYVQGGETNSVELTSSETVDYTISDLKTGTPCSVRVCSYVAKDERELCGKWSDYSSAVIQKLPELSRTIDPKKPMVALTFDDGPGYNKSSDKILDTLQKYKAHATFFMVGKNAADHPKNLKRKVALGCELGNHTMFHDHYGKSVTPGDIRKCSEAIYDATGQYPTAFRSPGGATTDTIKKECKTESMPLYYWSLDTLDWRDRDADTVYNRVMKKVKDGDIILMHEIYDSTADAVARLVPALQKEGYQLVTCEELMLAKTKKAPVPGRQYTRARAKH